ncbi:MAG: NTP transferase domain-containing protein, partial [Candidatus Eremiobacterota bacterium]
MKVSGLLLAAGAGRRMGQPKPLVRLGGRTLLEHTLDFLLALELHEVLVVLGHRAEEVGAALPGGV